MFGCLPFSLKKLDFEQAAFQKQINSKKLFFPDRKKFNIEYTDDVKDFLKKLLNKDPTKRLGASLDDVKELKDHKWFNNTNWDQIISKKVKAKIIPKLNKDLSKPENEYKELTQTNFVS